MERGEWEEGSLEAQVAMTRVGVRREDMAQGVGPGAN